MNGGLKNKVVFLGGPVPLGPPVVCVCVIVEMLSLGVFVCVCVCFYDLYRNFKCRGNIYSNYYTVECVILLYIVTYPPTLCSYTSFRHFCHVTQSYFS